jgi:hypothetical protein
MPMRRLLFAVLAPTVLAAACSSSGSSEITEKAAQALAPDVQAVRVAASGTSRSHLNAAVNQLHADVATQLGQGQVTSSRATAIDNAAGALVVTFDDKVPPPHPSVTPTSPSSSPSTPTPTPTVTTTVTVTPTPTPTHESSSPSTSTASP